MALAAAAELAAAALAAEELAAEELGAAAAVVFIPAKLVPVVTITVEPAAGCA